MKTDSNFLEIPTEFRKACVICDFPVQRILQSFIAHISMYQSLSNEFHGNYSLATNALLSPILKQRRGPSTPFLQQRQQSIKYLGTLISLVAAKEPSEEIKRENSREIIDKIYQAVCPYASFKDYIYIDETQVLTFTPDFCVLCELHNYEPKEVLENFMKDISLAECSARSRLKMEDDNMAMAFFLEMVSPYPKSLNDFSDKIGEIQQVTVMTTALPYLIQRYQELYDDLYEQILRKQQEKQ